MNHPDLVTNQLLS